MTHYQTKDQPSASLTRRDIHQQVTDSIIQQLEAGTVPWRKPWNGGNNRPFKIPQNLTTGKKYRGINILLLWGSAFKNHFTTDEWGSFKQWQEKKECVRKGEKGSMIVYYDTMEKEVEGELKKIPFIKSSVVFNRSQLASYEEEQHEELKDLPNLIERVERVDSFITNTEVTIEHKDYRACYVPSEDKILMPHQQAFKHTETRTATEGYYSVLLHELTHWTGSPKRTNRKFGKKFGDKDYATEELIAELGAAFMCAEFGITAKDIADHSAYIASWLQVLKNNKHCIITAASEASKAIDFLQGLQPD
jgi:antirestriction protein ArdC